MKKNRWIITGFCSFFPLFSLITADLSRSEVRMEHMYVFHRASHRKKFLTYRLPDRNWPQLSITIAIDEG